MRNQIIFGSDLVELFFELLNSAQSIEVFRIQKECDVR